MNSYLPFSHYIPLSVCLLIQHSNKESITLLNSIPTMSYFSTNENTDRHMSWNGIWQSRCRKEERKRPPFMAKLHHIMRIFSIRIDSTDRHDQRGDTNRDKASCRNTKRLKVEVGDPAVKRTKLSWPLACCGLLAIQHFFNTKNKNNHTSTYFLWSGL